MRPQLWSRLFPAAASVPPSPREIPPAHIPRPFLGLGPPAIVCSGVPRTSSSPFDVCVSIAQTFVIPGWVLVTSDRVRGAWETERAQLLLQPQRHFCLCPHPILSLSHILLPLPSMARSLTHMYSCDCFSPRLIPTVVPHYRQQSKHFLSLTGPSASNLCSPWPTYPLPLFFSFIHMWLSLE